MPEIGKTGYAVALGFFGDGAIDGRGEREAVVGAALVKHPHVFEAKQHVNRAVPVGDEHGVIVGHVGGIDVFHPESDGILRLRSGHGGDAHGGAPRAAIVGAAAQQNANVVPVAHAGGTLPCLAPSEHGAFRGHDDTGNVVDVVVWMIADGEDRVLMSWLDGRRAADAAAGATSHAAHDHESAPMTLRSAVIDRAGNITREYEIDNRTCSCCQTDMARWNEQKLIVYRDRTEAEIRDISVAIYSLGRWEAPSVVHHDQWKIEGCPVNGPAIAANGERGLIFWPTVTDDKMTLRYVVADSPRALLDKPQMRTLPLTQVPSGRVDAIAWQDGFLLTWISRARDRPAVDYAYVHPDGRVEAGLSIAEPALRGRATGFPRAASDGKTAIVVWPELDGNGNAVIGVALTR